MGYDCTTYFPKNTKKADVEVRDLIGIQDCLTRPRNLAISSLVSRSI